jgi:hypothetical protein
LYNIYAYKTAQLYQDIRPCTTKNQFMLFLQFLSFLMIVVIFILIISSILIKKKNLPVKLFIEAQKNENDGYFEEAVIVYESALNEVKKTRFHGGLKNKIVDKLKVLHTTIEYRNNLRFIR